MSSSSMRTADGELENDARVGVAMGIGLETACEISLRLARPEGVDLGVAGGWGEGDSDDGEAWVREEGEVEVKERERSSMVAEGER